MNDAEKEELLKQVNTMLLAMIGSPKLVDVWWNSQNFHFKLEKPYLVWEYDPQSVYDYVCGYAMK